MSAWWIFFLVKGGLILLLCIMITLMCMIVMDVFLLVHMWACARACVCVCVFWEMHAGAIILVVFDGM